MQENVINLSRFLETKRPNDLLKIKDFEKKYGLKYEYLYKWSVQKKQIKVYSMGGIALSEREVLEFEERKAQKYGRN
jgi:hypothetical protein